MLALMGIGIASTYLVAAPFASGATMATPPFHAHGSIDEAYVIGAAPGNKLVLKNSVGKAVGSGTADALGSLVVRNVAPARGYVFVDTTTSTSSAPFTVLSTSSVPPPSLYNQTLHVGLNYVTMRDGIKIAMTVRLPAGKTSLSQGPFPTVMEYSGYATAGPDSLVNVLLNTPGSNAKDPLLPSSSTIVGSAVAPLLGFASVSVQIRGTGCSGGAFDLFGYPTDYDGYDAIETIGGQPWVLHHKVAMVGISYSGISQFEVAGTNPPDLAAITPLSSTDDLFSTGYPGGIFNDGFAKSWINDRINDAKPATAAGGGQPWTAAEIRAEAAQGVTTCLDNQVLHGQSEALSSLVGPGLSRNPALFDRRSPVKWAAKVKVPVFLVGALQDEQTGPQWPALIAALKNDPNVYATMVNGGHIDSLGPATITRWLEFLDIYLSQEVPKPSPILNVLAPALYSNFTDGAGVMPLDPIRFTDAATVSQAKSEFKAQDPRVRVLFDYGGSSLGAGSLKPNYEASFSSWPPQGSITTLFLGPHGALASAKPATASKNTFTPAPEDRPATTLQSSDNAWAAQPPFNWTPVPSADGLAYQTPTLTKDLTIVGPASLDLSLASTAKVTDLQVSVTEVRPGTNQEVYVTSGFLSSANRTLLPSSTPLWPQPTYLLADKQPMPKSGSVLVRVPIDPIAHTFRAGTALRIVISAPGGDRPSWAFATPSTGHSVTDTVTLGGATPSKLVVNEVSNVAVSPILPACGALRGEPCRAYATLNNQ
jgi:predicted acyl esterase